MRSSDWSSDVCSSDLSGNIGFGEDRKQVDPEPLELLVRIHQLAYDLVDDAGFTSRVFDPVGQLRRPSFGLLDNPTAQGGKRGYPAFQGILDRKSVVSGTSVAVRLEPGGRRTIKKKKR